MQLERDEQIQTCFKLGPLSESCQMQFLLFLGSSNVLKFTRADEGREGGREGGRAVHCIMLVSNKRILETSVVNLTNVLQL